ncbi:MAG: sigma-54-dependent Fis family transcriptional regulator [Acidobacteria bacterium]|nr:sigma-54-dependent Fis family transcriptional regulator [Acidobacteriota bacterium]
MSDLLKSFTGLKLMIVDDEKNIREMVKLLFEAEGYQVIEAEDGQEALRLYEISHPNVILMDVAMPVMDGLTACEKIRQSALGKNIPILMVTSMSDIKSIEKGFAAGATDYVTKPLNWIVLKQRILHLVKISIAERQVATLQHLEQIHNYTHNQEKNENLLIGSERTFLEIKELVEKAALTDAPVLITGETGTGKNVLAKAIHHSSEGKRKAFVSINCAALPEGLIDAELFGSEKGAYTNSVTTRKGVFELADKGTLFLDEIGEMPISLQTKLLSVLEEKQVRRLGGENSRNIDVRVIAATNANPEEAIELGKLRIDLFYRLSVIRIKIPPLRERREDIPKLCDYFIKKFAPNRQLILPNEEFELLKNYYWPGNVRELRNIIERCIILQPGPEIHPSELLDINSTKKNTLPNDIKVIDNRILTLEDVERQHILKTFYNLGKNQTHTAQALNISLTTLKRKLKEYKIT